MPGTVSDGNDVNNDVNYTSETATVTTSWADFSDPESGLADYSMSVVINGEVQKRFTGISETLRVFSDHSLSLQHGDSVFVELQASNRCSCTVQLVPLPSRCYLHAPYVSNFRCNTLGGSKLPTARAASANQNVTSTLPRQKPEERPPCLPPNLQHSKKRKTGGLGTNHSK